LRKHDGRRGEGVGLGNDDGRRKHFGSRKHVGKRKEGVGLGDDDGMRGKARRAHFSKCLHGR
jgi:hypothetical protein